MDIDPVGFNSHRSVLVCKNGCVASSQYLASQVGIDILKQGGNAADAAVAVAAALNLTEPSSTGIGGDAFCLYYDSKTKKVHGLNGSGRAPGKLSLEVLHKEGYNVDNPLPVNHGHSVTVPGSAAAWCATIEKFGSGKLTVADILEPAICMAEEGFPVQKITAHSWAKGSWLLKDERNEHGQDLLVDGQPPRHGQIMKNKSLASTFREVATKGTAGFYEGRIAEEICKAVARFGGVMSMEDLKAHTTTFEEPIRTDYKGHMVWEIPPNGQGITALMALNILEGFDLKAMGHNSAEYLHTLIEALRLSFADVAQYCADPSKVHVPIEKMLSKQYAAERRKLIDNKKALPNVCPGERLKGCDTVYFSVADSEGNACSFINSNYMGFGTGIVPAGCGFTLQNRGLNFSLDPTHPNVVAPNKRPYHTIIPAMVTKADTGELLASYGVMGGFMQPQGHVQVLLNMLEFGLDPQQALDAPRFCIGHGHTMGEGSLEHVAVEEGIADQVTSALKVMGHNVTPNIGGYSRALFGRGQVIARGPWSFIPGNGEGSVYWAGSDPRADGAAFGY
ncbi:glutathione hydrolase-like YwrD proenzyme [Mya arenaria]|uniref:glutathione hydrolase-like YwrD proenzyme n=1 Tax=Mya arenaria TaxID=6604 RepID=UPI0022E16CF1|nr:glutathione hydrolase-like YwrD proenzyme [Mya arenaria]